MGVAHDMPLEAIQPPHGRFAPLREALKDPMVMHTAVVTDGQGGRIHERQAHAGAEAGLQVGVERADWAGHEFHAALVTHGVRKLAVEVTTHIPQVVGFEVTKAHLVELDQDRHNFTHS